ncbi:MAG: hypothetical protein KBG39_04685 [Opitutaceae bacterium]|jgi:hypothetical protein|nr:hypothetical protein [Opitutaceae bacterium]MBP8962219.1 hypothetical protein [Opitutaceae bacterium]
MAAALTFSPRAIQQPDTHTMSDAQPASSDAIKKRVDVQAAIAAAQNQTSISAPLGDWTLKVDLKLEPNAAVATPADGTETPVHPVQNRLLVPSLWLPWKSVRSRFRSGFPLRAVPLPRLPTVPRRPVRLVKVSPH